MNQTTRVAANGALAGGVATLLMTALMKAYQATGLFRGPIPPTRITRAALDVVGAGNEVDDETETAVMAAGHWGYGMACGALFGVLHTRIRPPIPTAVHGTLFGLLIWALSYMGWVPAAGIMPHPARQNPAQAFMPLLAHVVYGSTLGLTFDALDRRG